jgi:MFS family permease
VESIDGRGEPGGREGAPAAVVQRQAPARYGRGLLGQVQRFYPALGAASFRLLWLSMFPAMLAWQMIAIANGYVAYLVSGSALALGVVSVATGLPVALFSLAGGVVADRLSRRAVLVATQLAFAASAAILAVLILVGRLEVWHLAAMGFVQGTTVAFNMPARQAYIAELVGPRLLRNATALNSAGMNFSRITGPPLAGGLLALPAVGPGGVFVLIAVLYGVVAVALLRLPATGPANGEEARSRRSGGWAEMQEGLAYLWASPVLRALLGMAAVPLIFGLTYQPLMPLFAEEVFAVGASGLGALMAAVGVGALGGSVLVATVSGHSRPALLQLGLGVGFGVALIAFAAAPTFPVAVGLLVVVGFMSAAYIALNTSLLISHTDARLYGRVMSVYLLTFAFMPVAALPASWLADLVGGRAAVALGGALVAISIAGIGILYPPIRRIR